jgi:hypothetical protein
MSEIVNLKRAKKQRARAEADSKAAANRAAHGRTKAEKTQTHAEGEAAAKRLDAHKRDSDG